MGNKKGVGMLKGFDLSVVKDEELAQLFDVYDNNKNGVLEREEAYVFLKDCLTFYSKKVQEEFKKTKKEQGGVISEEEEQKLVQSIDTEKNLSDYSKSMFKKMDEDGNGSIDKPEFIVWFRAYTKEQFGI
jgi:Ca2+-binding EF-hand superfamily protein